jgi:hypothetical protein
MLFGGCIVGAMLLAKRGLAVPGDRYSQGQPLPLRR